MKDLYQKGLLLTLIGLITMLIAGNITNATFVFELKPLMYIISGIFFAAGFSFFSFVYIKSKESNIRKRRTASYRKK